MAMEKPDSALQLLTAEREAYGKTHAETEEAYYQLYQSLPSPDVTPGSPSKGPVVAFVVHAASLLAHVQLMRGVLREKDIVVVLGGDTEAFHNLLPCKAICLPPLPIHERFEALRDRLKENRVGTLIWVSVPMWARYAFALRLAEKQVFWAMRFHPIAPGDLNITAGKRGEKTRMFHGVEWACVHSPFNVEIQPVDKLRCEALRPPYAYIYGTIARPDKLTPEYLDCVARILEAHPEAGFLWTGRQEKPLIRQFFRSRGLSSRHWFAGWVDPDPFVNLMDCFLETFPLGGLTTFTAMGHGIPVVALQNEHSPIGSLETPPQGLLAARDGDEYVRMALAVQDRETRQKAVEAGHKVFQTELAQIERDRRDFWAVIGGKP